MTLASEEGRINGIPAHVLAANTVTWLDNLSNYHKGKGCLSYTVDLPGKPKVQKWCILGAGCEILGVPYEAMKTSSPALALITGLRSQSGRLEAPEGEQTLTGKLSLVSLNDETKLTFADMVEYLRQYPHHAFIDPVAELIKGHYAGTEELF